MSDPKSFVDLWNFMELSEKQRLMRQFLSQHGDHFSREDFVRFLALRYESGPQEFGAQAGTYKHREPRA